MEQEDGRDRCQLCIRDPGGGGGLISIGDSSGDGVQLCIGNDREVKVWRGDEESGKEDQ